MPGRFLWTAEISRHGDFFKVERQVLRLNMTLRVIVILYKIFRGVAGIISDSSLI